MGGKRTCNGRLFKCQLWCPLRAVVHPKDWNLSLVSVWTLEFYNGDIPFSIEIMVIILKPSGLFVTSMLHLRSLWQQSWFTNCISRFGNWRCPREVRGRGVYLLDTRLEVYVEHRQDIHSSTFWFLVLFFWHEWDLKSIVIRSSTFRRTVVHKRHKFDPKGLFFFITGIRSCNQEKRHRAKVARL